ncbi:hypothetical protein L873DRAFT_1820783 [Choiromyces venosus 120613-1]|uniref:Uncharacterized protein n=1 Tax=Choiromyces venosus 120613-1 TaxID=1336337 RepID=A0A3N4J9T8_9PEZI|nr:hypothetical protein L873DRAFT_1820783 [Choiromyces venosus 120613-1]
MSTQFPTPREWYAVELSNSAKTQFSYQKLRSLHNFVASFVPSCYYSSENLNTSEVTIEAK